MSFYFFSEQCYYEIFLNLLQTFAEESRKQVGVLKNMFAKMESLYKELGEFFAFDPAKYTSEDLFSDLKNFKDSFHVCVLLQFRFFIDLCIGNN